MTGTYLAKLFSDKGRLVFIMASIEYAGCVRPEIERINYLLQRDGEKATRAWVERTLRIYREAITKPGSHASNATYRPLFEKAIHEFEEWLAMPPSAGTTSVLEHVR